MKRYSQFILVLILFALLGRTVVTAVSSTAVNFGTTSTASPSDWSEVPVEEDESGDDDKTFHEFQAFGSIDISLSSGEILHSFLLLDHDQEIIVPPPQG